MAEPGRDLYVHVGLPKTGTTFVQDTLFGSSETLAERGVAMIPPTRKENLWLTMALRDRVDPKVDPPAMGQAVDRFTRQLRESTAPKVVVTEERLAPATRAHVDRFAMAAEDSRIHLVVTLRSFSQLVPSAWQQRVKGGNALSLDDFVEALHDRTGGIARVFWRGRDLPELFNRWSSHVPPERVHICTLPASRSSGTSLLDRFCAALDVSSEALTPPASRVNASIGLAQTELLRRVNEIAPPDLVTRRGHERRTGWDTRHTWLGLHHLGAQEGTPARMPIRWRDWCEDVAAADIDFLRTSGVHIHGDLDDLRPRPEDFSDHATPDVEDVLAAATRALADIVAERTADQLAVPKPKRRGPLRRLLERR